MINNIVVPVDLDDMNSWRAALPRAIDYARHVGARLHALAIVPDNLIKMTVVAQVIPKGFEEKLIEDAKGRLRALIAGQETKDLAIEQAIRFGSIYGEILRYARDVEADLIVMASHKPELKDFLLGPNAAHVVRHADCSVWVVRE